MKKYVINEHINLKKQIINNLKNQRIKEFEIYYKNFFQSRNFLIYLNYLKTETQCLIH